MANIKVKDLTDTQTIDTDNEIMVLTNENTNLVQNITVGNFITNVISSDSDNVIEQGADGKLYVETPENITGELSDLTTTEKSSLVGAINEVNSDLATEVTNRVNAVSGEATMRANADNNLQSQIDAITAASDVTDIVGTYAQLQDYDTTGLPDKSIIKVLQDESRENETTYYRWVITGGVGAWVLIGEEGPYYTISQADSKFATQTTVGNLNNLATSDKSSVVNAMNELASVLDPTQTADYIKNSKAIYSGEVSENALILPQIKEMAHSTFDLSKFTIVGSPTITNDGIASGFSGSDYLKTIQLSQLANKSWSIKVPMSYLGNSINENQPLISFGYVFASEGSITYVTSSKKWFFRARTGLSTDTDNSGNKIIRESAHSEIPNNSICELSFNINSGVYSMYVDGVFAGSWTATTTNKQIYAINNNPTDYLYIAHSKQNGVYENAIDLKQFSITVDGVEVFSGNKTDIDTIKPDDYQVVGAPTISADGIASGFSSSNYLQTVQVGTLNADTFKIKQQFKLNNAAIQGTFLSSRYTAGLAEFGIALIVNSSKLLFFASSNGTSWDIASGTQGTTTLSSNVDYKVELEFTGTQYICYLTNLSSEVKTTEFTINSSAKIYSGINYICLGFQGWDALQGSIDLNTFKIYVDGDLVYQPCLKIPYTWSSTGSKIADAAYRNRVIDAYEQGFNYRYYTLDEDNGNFALPMGEIYGIIENKVDVNTATQTEKNAVIGWLAPDYDSSTKISVADSALANSGYTVDVNGIVNVSHTSSAAGNRQLYINGILVWQVNYTSGGGDTGGGFACPVSPGDVLTGGTGTGVQIFKLKGGN